MHGVQEIVEEASALPVDERAAIVEALLRTLNTPNPDIDAQWIDVAQKRLEGIESGQVKAISVESVVSQVRERFAK